MDFKKNLINANIIGLLIYDLCSRYNWTISIDQFESFSNSIPQGITLSEIQNESFYSAWADNLEEINYLIPDELETSLQLKRAHFRTLEFINIVGLKISPAKNVA